jgi:hypothetical protein
MERQQWSSGLPAQFMTIGEFGEQIGDLRNGGGARLAAQIAFDHYHLVVIDTLSRAVVADQKDVSEMTTALSPVHTMAHELGCTVLFVDHHRKGFGGNPDAVVDVLGSIGKAALADCLIGLYRERGKVGAKLITTGRDIEEQELDIVMDWPTGCWHCNEQSNEISPAKQKLLDALDELGEARVQELANATGRNKGSVFKDLADLINAKLVQKTGAGKGNVVYQVVRQIELPGIGEKGGGG